MPELTKTTCLMERDPRADSESACLLERDPRGDNGSVEFAARDEDTGERTRGVNLSAEDFHLLGDPRQLTVTIEPGDTLNQ